MSSTLKKTKQLLSELSKDELKEVNALTKAHLSQEDSRFKDKTKAGWLSGLIIEALEIRTGSSMPSGMALGLLKKYGTEYQEAADFADEWSNSLVKKANITTGRAGAKHKLLRFVIEAIMDELECQHIPVKPKFIIEEILNAPIHLDNSFPGYASSGACLGILINSKRQNPDDW